MTEKKTVTFFKEVKDLKDRKEMTLAEAIVDALGSELDETKLSPNVLKMMQLLPATESAHLSKIDTFFKKIVEDKKISASDVPTLFLLMQELYALYNDLHIKTSSSEVGETLQVLLQILILYKLNDTSVFSTEDKETMLALIDSLIKMCTNMMEFKGTIKKHKSLLRKMLFMK